MKELEDYVNEKKAHKYLDEMSDGDENAPAGEKEIGITPGSTSMHSTAPVDRSLNHSNSQQQKPRSSRKLNTQEQDVYGLCD